MTGLVTLWLPILLSAVFVFVVSAIVHMLPLWHRNDFPAVPNEERVRTALGPLAIPPGDYVVPRASTSAEMRTPEYARKLEEGPVLMMTVMPNAPVNMARNMALWFLYTLAVSFFAAYIASRALPPASDDLAVFRFAGATAFIGYAVALWQNSIWYNRSWRLTLIDTFDGLIYALLTAGVFGWLWPR